MLTLVLKGNCIQEHMNREAILKARANHAVAAVLSKQISVSKCAKQTLKNMQLKKWQHLAMIYLGVNLPVLCQA